MTLLNEINEAQRTKTKTKTATRPDVGIGVGLDASMFNEPEFHAPAVAPKSKAASAVRDEPVPKLRQATKQRTQQKMAGVEMPDEAGEKFASLAASGMEDEISNAEAAQRAGVEDTPYDLMGQVNDPEPTTTGTDLVVPENLPAVVNQDIATATEVEPEWSQVKNLPGYLSSPIRAMGRQVFGHFTETPIEDIQVIANLGGGGPNSEREINATAEWLQQNGVEDSSAVMDFERAIEGYQAEMIVYRARGYTFLLVRDFAGQYVYSWPSNDEKSAERPELGTDTPRNRLT